MDCLFQPLILVPQILGGLGLAFAKGGLRPAAAFTTSLRRVSTINGWSSGLPVLLGLGPRYPPSRILLAFSHLNYIDGLNARICEFVKRLCDVEGGYVSVLRSRWICQTTWVDLTGEGRPGVAGTRSDHVTAGGLGLKCQPCDAVNLGDVGQVT